MGRARESGGEMRIRGKMGADSLKGRWGQMGADGGR